MSPVEWPRKFVIKILGNFWTVRIVDHPLEMDGCSLWGYKDSDLSEIVLSSQGNVVATLIHELEHVFAEILRIPDDTPEADAVIERIAQLTMAFIVDNPQLINSVMLHVEENVKKNKKHTVSKSTTKKSKTKRRKFKPPTVDSPRDCTKDAT